MAPQHEIYQACGEQFGVVPKTAQYYIAQAQIILDREIKITQKRTLREQIHHLRRLSFRAESSGDLSLAHSIAQDIAKLCELYPAEKSELERALTRPINFISISQIPTPPPKLLPGVLTVEAVPSNSKVS